MRQQYQRIFFEYVKLATILVHTHPTSLTHTHICAHDQAQQARLFRYIATESRYYGEYFYVGFWGLGWPSNLLNRQFIYRGYDLEVQPSSLNSLPAPLFLTHWLQNYSIALARLSSKAHRTLSSRTSFALHRKARYLSPPVFKNSQISE